MVHRALRELERGNAQLEALAAAPGFDVVPCACALAQREEAS